MSTLALDRVSGCGVFRPLSPSGCYCAACLRGEGCPITPRQVELCRQWIRTYCTPRKTINPRARSYALKHQVEHWARTIPEPDRYAYIANGAFIAAALLEGYRAEVASINASFGMSLPRRAGA